jgi:hypothetical protein
MGEPVKRKKRDRAGQPDDKIRQMVKEYTSDSGSKGTRTKLDTDQVVESEVITPVKGTKKSSSKVAVTTGSEETPIPSPKKERKSLKIE